MSALRTSPTQKRSVERLAMIIDAGRQVLAEVGRDRITTGMVAEAAGGSIGSFYRYFPDRVALLDAIAPDRDLAQQKLDEIQAAMSDSFVADLSLIRDLVGTGFEGLVHYEALDRLIEFAGHVRSVFAPVLSAEELAKVHAFGLDVAEVAS